MPENHRIKYEFVDYDEAMKAFEEYKNASSETSVWPTFTIHHVDVDILDGDATIWLEMVKK